LSLVSFGSFHIIIHPTVSVRQAKMLTPRGAQAAVRVRHSVGRGRAVLHCCWLAFRLKAGART